MDEFELLDLAREYLAFASGYVLRSLHPMEDVKEIEKHMVMLDTSFIRRSYTTVVTLISQSKEYLK
jgi:hypothetical protein